MFWGKFAAIAATTFLLAGCSGTPVAKPTASPTPTPTPTPSFVVKVQTGDPEADRLIAILNASCAYAKANGLVFSDAHASIYTFPAASDMRFWDWWNTMHFEKGKYFLSGYPDGDPLCIEAMYANRVVAVGSKKNANGVVFDYELKKVNATTYDWAVYRQSPDRTFTRITVSGNLVSGIKWSPDMNWRVGYGPFSQKLIQAHEKAMRDENVQYLPIAQAVHGMKVAQAKSYLKKHGLSLLIAMQDGVNFYPSGPPQGKSDPKRIMVNVMDGVIVGYWTM